MGEIVAYCVQNDKKLQELTLRELREFSKLFDEDVFRGDRHSRLPRQPDRHRRRRDTDRSRGAGRGEKRVMKRLALYTALIIALFGAGCGVKGPPTMPPPPSEARIVNAEAVYKPGKGVVLSWDTDTASPELSGFTVTRGEEPIGSSRCRACEDFYQPLATLTELEAVTVADSLSGEALRKFAFVDQDIKVDYQYFYRLRPAYKNGANGAGVGVSVETKP